MTLIHLHSDLTDTQIKGYPSLCGDHINTCISIGDYVRKLWIPEDGVYCEDCVDKVPLLELLKHTEL